MSDSGDDAISALITYTSSGEIHQSAGSTSNKEYDFLDFLGIAQSLKIDFLPITWQPALEKVGEGGTAVIRQALVTLQMTFTFKHLKPPWSAMEKTRNLRALVAEVSILGHPAIRYHPNVANVEGICWDVVSGGEEVWPVLVFEKTRHGDLNRFMTSGPGKELDSKHRLDILCDIALAVRDLHAAGVIHGDIKPENILISSENRGRYVAKVTDFGYSTLFATESDPIVMPYSELWAAPEQHHRAILPIQARKMDAYSFGMLCLWLLFYNTRAHRDRNFKTDLLDLQRSENEVSSYASGLLEATAGLENREKDSVQKVFKSTLGQDPGGRTSNFNDLLELLSLHRDLNPVSPADSISIPHNDFQITGSLHQLIEAHYGVRYYIARCLQEKADRPSTGPSHTLDLALCYELGLGIPRDVVRCRSLLSEHNISIRDLEDVLERLKENSPPLEFQRGIFQRLLEQGHFDAFDYSQQYREELGIGEAELQYQREIETLESALADDHRIVQELRRQLSSLMTSEGRWKDAENLQIQMIELDKRVTDGGQQTVRFASYLASTYRYQGRWKEAEQLEIQIIETRKKVTGTEHPDMLISMANLASTYWNQGRWKEAEELEVQVMETSKRVLGVEHPRTLMTMANLASTYSNQGRWLEAEKIELSVVETRKKALGIEHPDTLNSIASLAVTYSSQGRLKKAEELEVQAVETRKEVLGAGHPGTLTSIANLASTYSNQGRWKEAKDLQLQVIEMREKVIGTEHPDTLISKVNLATTYRRQGRWKDAEELEIQVTETSKRLLGLEHPTTLICITELASTYWSQGRWKEAEELQLQVIDASKRVLGVEHPDTLTSISNLALTYREQSRLKEAKELRLEVMETSERVLGIEHPSTLISMTNLASTYISQEQWKEAEELQLKVMETSKKVLGVEHPKTLGSTGNLASTYWSQGRYKEAEELQLRVTEMSKRVLGAEHPDTLTGIANLAITYWHQGRWKEAEELKIQVMESSKVVLGVGHPSTLLSMADVVTAYWSVGKWKEARELHAQVMEMKTRLKLNVTSR